MIIPRECATKTDQEICQAIHAVLMAQGLPALAKMNPLVFVADSEAVRERVLRNLECVPASVTLANFISRNNVYTLLMGIPVAVLDMEGVRLDGAWPNAPLPMRKPGRITLEHFVSGECAP